MGRRSAPRPFLARLRRMAARRAFPTVSSAVALALAGAADPAWAQGPTPQGSEFRVNAVTSGGQYRPDVAMDADGDFVIVWDTRGLPYAQRFDADGLPLGERILVPSATSGYQVIPSVAMDEEGSFVVVWLWRQLVDLMPMHVRAQRFSPAGIPVGAEIAETTARSYGATVAMDADGDFAVAWQREEYATGDSRNVYAHRYDATGTPEDVAFRVHPHTTGQQAAPAVAMNADGDLVVAWGSDGADGNAAGIRAQRYDSTRAPVGSEFWVGGGAEAGVAMGADGRAVFVWAQAGGVYARRFDAAGAPIGAAFRVNNDATGAQTEPAVAMDADGAFTVAWSSNGQDGSGLGVYAQAYSAEGTPVGGAFRVNTYTTGDQRRPSVAMGAGGRLVITWDSYLQDGSTEGVYAQRYVPLVVSAEPAPPSGLTLSIVPSPLVGAQGRVRYAVPAGGTVRLAVYDALGREVAVLQDGDRGAGTYEAALDAGALAPGVYILRLTTGGATLIQRLTVAR